MQRTGLTPILDVFDVGASLAWFETLHALALQHGFSITWPPTNEPWGARESHLRQPDGHTFRVSAPLG